MYGNVVTSNVSVSQVRNYMLQHAGSRQYQHCTKKWIQPGLRRACMHILPIAMQQDLIHGLSGRTSPVTQRNGKHTFSYLQD